MVEHRCLRCGALVGDAEPAASTVHGPAAPDPEPDALLPRPSELPPAASEPAANGSEPNGDGHDDEAAPLAALTALRELGELHASGVLTDAEFAAKKAELLRRV
jgi:putative oligomerization/nucleic acid binding protein